MRSTEIVPDVIAGACTPISTVRVSFGIRKTSSKALNKATVQPSLAIRSESASVDATPLTARLPNVMARVSGVLPVLRTVTSTRVFPSGSTTTSDWTVSMVAFRNELTSSVKSQAILTPSSPEVPINLNVGP